MKSNDRIKENQRKIENNIPLSMKWRLPALSKSFGGWVKGSYTLITGNTGQGKTKLTKFLVLDSVLDFRKKYPHIPVKIMWFLLEESEEEFEDSLMSSFLYTKFNISLSPMQLKGFVESPVKISSIQDKINSCQKDVDLVMSLIVFTTDITNGTGIYKRCREELLLIGKEITTTIPCEDGSNLVLNTGFEYNDPETYFFVVVDNFNFITCEKRNGIQMDRTASIEDFSKHYLSRQLKDRFNCVVVGVQQQASETERVEYFKGEPIIGKLEPSLNGLGLSKNTQQDATLVIGVFNPMRYNTNPEKPAIPLYRGYDVMQLRGMVVWLIMLKDRHYGFAAKAKALYVNWAANYFEEMPPPEEVIYAKYKS